MSTEFETRVSGYSTRNRLVRLSSWLLLVGIVLGPEFGRTTELDRSRPGISIGRIVGVSDGDTVTVLLERTPTRCRLYGIDAPESGQAWGQRAKQALSSMVFGRIVEVEVVGKPDRYNRLICRLQLDGRDINLDMVKAGMAWTYTAYNRDRRYLLAQDAAIASKLGLWGDTDAVPPWEYRRTKNPRGH